MPDLEDLFVEFETAAAATFRPPGVADAQRRIRGRRRRRGLLAGLLAVVLAGPASALAVAHRADRPEPRPTPSVSPSPTGRLTVRTVTLPGVPGELADLRFVSARAGWALFDTCVDAGESRSGCRRTVARTVDGGVTWQRAGLPAVPDGGFQLLPVDTDTLVVTTRAGYLVTADGGNSFTSHPYEAPPVAVRRVFATPSGLYLGCPPDGVRPNCDRQRVLRVSGGLHFHQPPVTLRSDTENALVEGADGRLWLTVGDDNGLTVVTSADQGTTWQELPPVPRAARQLALAPDGRDVWLVRTTQPNGVWRLAGTRWEPGPALPDDTDGIAAPGAGLLVVTSAYGGLGFVTGGGYVEVPELRGPLRTSDPRDSDPRTSVSVLPDGTVLAQHGRSWFLGVGRGMDRSWFQYS
ncbi:cell wall synthesis protein CwsA [Micromonospora sp. WMMD980]|uniref:cell wall synthesis protein CwsA n=1 Tax=Micromonospora sp. WMMD980 TaxID=3016088 RepID=UPI002416E14A|nr:cell wall synthesis protein CwsA [Micromonospora sp. WMMD980]MDG4803968.1 cell wall synthesis protein CwsA [Micromonospora sp. WMMD980]